MNDIGDGTHIGSLSDKLSILSDHRVERTKRHSLTNIMVIAICAVVCGADSWVDIEEFGKAKREWLSGFLDLSNGIPSHDTFGRFFAMLDSESFERFFSEWVMSVSELTTGQVIAIDGKTVRRSHDSFIGRDAIHMVSAWATANHVSLGQLRVDGHSNEIEAIPRLLEVLDVSGCIVTIDAMGCQSAIADEIVERGADYVLALKANQPRLHESVSEAFTHWRGSEFNAMEHDFFQTVEKAHGRIETRSCWSVYDTDYIGALNIGGKWKGLSSIAMVESRRVCDGVESSAVRFYISSLSGRARHILSASRMHWGVENSLHWVLDVAFGEDDSRVRVGNAAENLSVLRRMALNMLKSESSAKVGVAAKRKKAGWDTDYLIRVLTQ